MHLEEKQKDYISFSSFYCDHHKFTKIFMHIDLKKLGMVSNLYNTIIYLV
jgi:hypothetical protein